MFPVCPKCDEQLFVLQFKGIEVDLCPRCRGLWLDEGELEELMVATGANPADPLATLASHPAARPAKGRRSLCPRCDKPMAEVTLPASASDAAELTIDRCTLGHGMWFDAHELQRLLERFPADCSASRTIAYLNEVLGSTYTPNHREK